MGYRRLLIISGLILLSACGTRTSRNNDNNSNQQQQPDLQTVEQPTPTVQNPTTQTDGKPKIQQPPVVVSPIDGGQKVDISDNFTAAQLVGTWQEATTPSVKLIVDSNLLMATNLMIPFQPGDDSRLTPNLPHRLRLSSDGQSYITEGTFNRTGGDVDNVDVQVVGYSDGSTLDLTLTVQVRTTDIVTFKEVVFNGSLDGASNLLCGKPWPPKPPTPPSPPTCDKCCCCNCGDQKQPTPATKQMRFPYRFTRVQ